jgi:hypothetical protein
LAEKLMTKRQIIFIICVIWFFAWIPVAGIWGWRPISWLEGWPLASRVGTGIGTGPTVEDVQEAFPIRLAPLPASPIRYHASQIENEDTDPPPAFDASDWAYREMRYRWATCFLGFIFSTVCMRWLLSQIVSGQKTWLD